MENHYQTLQLPRSASIQEIKNSYRSLARKYHPDRNNSTEAPNLFKTIAEAYDVLSDPKKKEIYDRFNSLKTITIKSKRSTYTVGGIAAKGDLADIYKAVDETGKSVAFKIARDPRISDLLETEWENLQHVFKKPDNHSRYFPKIIETFQIEDNRHARRQVNVLEWLENWWTFEEVRKAFKSKLDVAHAIWMFNRLLGGLGFIHRRGLVHGAVTPSHALAYSSEKEVDPWNHGVKLVDWAYSVKIGSPLKVIVPGYRHFYPPEVFVKGEATPSLDIFMAAKSIQYVLGGDPTTGQTPSHTPEYLILFLKRCTSPGVEFRPNDAWQLHQEFREYIKPRRYVRFDMPSVF